MIPSNMDYVQVKFNHHLQASFKNLARLRDNQIYTDLTLSCNGHFYPAHRLVVSSCSDYLARSLQTIPMYCPHPIILLDGISEKTLQVLLAFMYDGVVTVHRNDLPEIMQAGQRLLIKGLTTVPSEDSVHGVPENAQSSLTTVPTASKLQKSPCELKEDNALIKKEEKTSEARGRRNIVKGKAKKKFKEPSEGTRVSPRKKKWVLKRKIEDSTVEEPSDSAEKEVQKISKDQVLQTGKRKKLMVSSVKLEDIASSNSEIKLGSLCKKLPPKPDVASFSEKVASKKKNEPFAQKLENPKDSRKIGTENEIEMSFGEDKMLCEEKMATDDELDDAVPGTNPSTALDASQTKTSNPVNSEKVEAKLCPVGKEKKIVKRKDNFPSKVKESDSVCDRKKDKFDIIDLGEDEIDDSDKDVTLIDDESEHDSSGFEGWSSPSSKKLSPVPRRNLDVIKKFASVKPRIVSRVSYERPLRRSKVSSALSSNPYARPYHRILQKHSLKSLKKTSAIVAGKSVNGEMNSKPLAKKKASVLLKKNTKSSLSCSKTVCAPGSSKPVAKPTLDCKEPVTGGSSKPEKELANNSKPTAVEGEKFASFSKPEMKARSEIQPKKISDIKAKVDYIKVSKADQQKQVTSAAPKTSSPSFSAGTSSKQNIDGKSPVTSKPKVETKNILGQRKDIHITSLRSDPNCKSLLPSPSTSNLSKLSPAVKLSMAQGSLVSQNIPSYSQTSPIFSKASPLSKFSPSKNIANKYLPFKSSVKIVRRIGIKPQTSASTQPAISTLKHVGHIQLPSSSTTPILIASSNIISIKPKPLSGILDNAKGHQPTKVGPFVQAPPLKLTPAILASSTTPSSGTSLVGKIVKLTPSVSLTPAVKSPILSSGTTVNQSQSQASPRHFGKEDVPVANLPKVSVKEKMEKPKSGIVPTGVMNLPKISIKDDDKKANDEKIVPGMITKDSSKVSSVVEKENSSSAGPPAPFPGRNVEKVSQVPAPAISSKCCVVYTSSSAIFSGSSSTIRVSQPTESISSLVSKSTASSPVSQQNVLAKSSVSAGSSTSQLTSGQSSLIQSLVSPQVSPGISPAAVSARPFIDEKSLSCSPTVTTASAVTTATVTTVAEPLPDVSVSASSTTETVCAIYTSVAKPIVPSVSRPPAAPSSSDNISLTAAHSEQKNAYSDQKTTHSEQKNTHSEQKNAHSEQKNAHSEQKSKPSAPTAPLSSLAPPAVSAPSAVHGRSQRTLHCKICRCAFTDSSELLQHTLNHD